jgi:hypothetical protein
MQIIDNALETIEYKKILQYFTSEEPQWHFMSNITYGYEHPKHDKTSWGFACSVSHGKDDVQDKYAYKMLQPLIMDKDRCMRIRCGFIVNVGPNKPHTPHIDQPQVEHLTQLYYLTASDAVTNIFEEYGTDEKYDSYKPEDFTIKHTSKPEPNRMCIFDGMHWHSSSPVMGKEARLCVSINYAK